MGPVPGNSLGDEVSDPSGNRLEVLHNGYYYDVTDFVKRHPGGSVIKFFTEKGEDATSAIEQFHHRSVGKVNLILKSLKKRPATDEDYQMDHERLKKHRALTEDYAKLFVEAQKEGLFEPSYLHICWRLFQIFTLLWAGITLQYYPGILIKILGAVLVGFACCHASYWMHEGGHNSLTGNPKLDKTMQSISVGFFSGVSAKWWNGMHNRHHAMPQRLHHDVDLQTTPLLAFHAKAVKDPKEGKSFLIQNQKWLLLSIDLFLVVTLWGVYLAPRSAIKNRNYLELFMMGLHWCFFGYFLSPSMLILAHWVAGTYLFGNFTLNHSWLPITEEHNHWVEYSLVHTADITDTWYVDWWMGYLNYQIEHHLFPTMPQFKNHLIKDRVRALAKKHGLPYHHYGYFEAWGKCLDNLAQVSHELKTA